MRGRAAVALFLAALVLAPPLVTVARSSTGTRTNEIPGLKRTNQVLSALIAFLKLCDEISQLPDPGDGTPMPPPIGTGHPGPLPGPHPCTTPVEETS